MSSQALIDKIIGAAEKEAEQITNDAMKRAAENEKLILDKAKEECEQIERSARERYEQIRHISELQSSIEGRKARLHARRAVLDKAYEKAYERIRGMESKEKTAFYSSLIIKYAPAPVITVTVAEADRALFDGKVLADLSDALKNKFNEESSVILSDKNGDDGVYIESEKADADATLKAIFEELRRNTEFEADRILFPQPV